MDRLTVRDKQQLQTVLIRHVYTAQAHGIEQPINTHREVQKLALSLIPRESRESVVILEQQAPHVLHRDSELFLRLDTYDDNVQIAISLSNYMPIISTTRNDRLTVPPDHPLHNELLEYWAQQKELSLRCTTARQYIETVTGSCNTIGQLKRVWPEVINGLSGQYVSSLSTAERASRIPPFLKNFDEDNSLQQTTTEVIALGCIVKTDERKDVTFQLG